MSPAIASPSPRASRLPAAMGFPMAILASLLISSPGLQAGDPPLAVYTMNDKGLLSVGGTVLEKLKSQFDPTADPPHAPEEQWVDLAVDGSDRWALRVDGRLDHNGQKLHTLPFDDELAEAPAWQRLAHSNAIYALRSDGLVAQDATADTHYSNATFTFLDVVAPTPSPFAQDPGILALRSDGGIFGSTFETPGMMLVGGPGVRGTPGVPGTLDGQFFDTTWTALAIDPTTSHVYGLRADGRVLSFAPDNFDASSGIDPGDIGKSDDGSASAAGAGPPQVIMPVAVLPFPDTTDFTFADLYTDIAFDTDGTWYVLRQDGAIFRSDDVTTPLIDLPGDGIDPDKVFVDFAAANGGFFALRFDGALYGTAGTPITDLQKKRYRSLALSDTPPDLSNFKNRKPVAVRYKATLLENEAITMPIIVNDIDRASEDLIVQVDLALLPDAIWDDEARTVSWPGGPAGKYSFTATVDDGVLKKPKAFRYKVRVVSTDDIPEKNRTPIPTKIKNVQLLVGIETALPLFATDRDGDVLTMSVNEEKGIFASGASFDSTTDTISWKPTFDDLGKQTATVFITDGTKVKKLKIKFTVVNPLIF